MAHTRKVTSATSIPGVVIIPFGENERNSK